MKTTTLCLVLVASAPPFLAAGEVAPGASLAEVTAVLGVPKGRAEVNGRQRLYYERGAVELQEGQVTQVSLRTAEEQAALEQREERMQAEREAQRARLIAEGTARRDRKLADAAFLATPLAFQVSYWEDFARAYPGVSCAEPLAIARSRLNEQLDERRRREQEAVRQAEFEERRLAAVERETFFYPVHAYPSYGGRRPYREFGLGQITYHFNDSSLSPYSTPSGSPYTSPSGNPAGSLSGSMVNFPATSPDLPNVYPRGEGGRIDCRDRRGAERGWNHRPDRS